MEISKGYKQTEFGLIPEDWEVKRIGEVAKIYDGTHQTPWYVPVGVHFYSVENVSNNEFRKTKFITENEYSILTKKYKIERGRYFNDSHWVYGSL